jgi:menaquinol-cytochrome c reductase iron-sulfur subunit
MADLHDQESGPMPARRRFLSWTVAILGTFVGVALGIPIIGYAISPALRREGQQWANAGSLDSLTVGQPTKVDYQLQRQDGWIQTTSLRSAWVVRQADGSLVVFDPRCTHLGCPYSWDTVTKRFLCPCHGGVFAADGTVLAGPPPRPLDRYQGRVENNDVMILEEAPSVG